MTRIAFLVLSSLLLATPGLADEKKLQNDNLKDKNWERLEGQNQFKLGCRHLVRSEDKTQVYHAAAVNGREIGIPGPNGWQTVKHGDKTVLHGGGGTAKITTWRNCRL